MENKHRGWQRILIFIVPYFVIVGFFQFLGMFIAGIDFKNLNIEETSKQHVIESFFSLLGTLLVIWIFMKNFDKEHFIQVGLESKNRINDFVIGIGLGGFIMSSGYLLLISFKQIQFQIVVFDFNEIFMSVLLFVMVALTEEILCRGYILKNLMLSFNKYIALIVSSALFSLMHTFNPNFDLFGLISIFLAGILLGISYIHTKNLWFPIALHLSWNFFQTFFGFKVSGKDIYSLIEISIPENNLLNGGDFGFEGSVFSIIASCIAIIGIEVYYIRKTNKSDEQPANAEDCICD